MFNQRIQKDITIKKNDNETRNKKNSTNKPKFNNNLNLIQNQSKQTDC